MKTPIAGLLTVAIVQAIGVSASPLRQPPVAGVSPVPGATALPGVSPIPGVTPVPTLAGTPPSPPQRVVSGTVRMPNGRVAEVDLPVSQRVVRLLAKQALALTGAVSPVGRGVAVRLTQASLYGTEVATGIVVETNDQGEFVIDLPSGLSEDLCPPLQLAVGAGDALTRALVYSSSAPVDIDFASEAAVRLIEERVAAGSLVCSFSPSEIGRLVAAIRGLPGVVPGGNAAEINANATRIAGANPAIQAVIDSVVPTRCDPNNPNACGSGFCVDGVCCEAAGCAPPERCDILGSEGSCTSPLPADSRCRRNSDCEEGLQCVSHITAIWPGPILSVESRCGAFLFPTPILFPTATSTPTRPIRVCTPRGGCTCCTGDCDADCSVTIDELLTMVNISLGAMDLQSCAASDIDAHGQLTVDEIVTAVNNALHGCPTPAP